MLSEVEETLHAEGQDEDQYDIYVLEDGLRTYGFFSILIGGAGSNLGIVGHVLGINQII